MRILKAEPKDIEQIVQINIDNWQSTYKGLLSEEFLNHLDPESLKEEWKDRVVNTLVAKEEDTVLGYGVSSLDNEITDCVYIDTLQVKEDMRGKGIGTAVLKTLLQNAFEKVSQCSICIVVGNDQARQLYQHLGFEHYTYFDDDFHGTLSHSEKLVLKREKMHV